MSSDVFIYEVIDDSGILLKMRRYVYLINQARGPYWENIGPGSWQYGLSAARSVLKRPRADISRYGSEQAW